MLRLLRSADLSGQVLDNRLAVEWGRRILEEFRTQADLESEAGLPPTTLASGDPETTMKGQHFFLARVSPRARALGGRARMYRVVLSRGFCAAIDAFHFCRTWLWLSVCLPVVRACVRDGD